PEWLQANDIAPPPLEARADAARVEAALADVRAFRFVSSYAAALDVAQRATAEAERIGYKPLEARAPLQRAAAAGGLGDGAKAEQTLKDAVAAALAGKDEESLAEAWTDLVRVVGYEQARFAEGHEWARYAEALVKRHGERPELSMSLDQHVGTLLLE